MSRRGTFLIVVMALCLAPAAHAGGWMIGLNGGWTFPTGDYGSADSSGLGATSGPQAGLEVGYMVTDRIVVGIDGAWVRNPLGQQGLVVDLGGGLTSTNNWDRFDILHVGAHAKFLVPMEGRSVRPYGMLGVGVYHVTHDYEYVVVDGGRTDIFSDEIDNDYQPGARVGAKLGLGAMFRASETIGIDLRGEFNFISMNKDRAGISSAQYLGLQAGLVYNIMPKQGP